jgi:hypothetical protein
MGRILKKLTLISNTPLYENETGNQGSVHD